MKILSLGLSGSPDEIRTRLQQDCRTLARDGFRVAVDESSKGNYTFLGCNIAEGELSFRNYEHVKNSLKTFVAQMLAEYIVSHEEKTLIRRIINHNYCYFGDQERAAIYDNALKLLEEPGGDFGYTDRRNRILAKIKEYFDIHHELVLDGFLSFRLKDYRDRLTEVVDKAVDEYMLDMEYKEFIRVLRYFVDVQEAQVDEVHIFFGDGDTFKIRDARGRNIHNQCVEPLIMRNEEINYEDLLISALITIAPQNVMLHFSSELGKNHAAVETIQNVFAGRVGICRGCSLCLNDVGFPESERN
ncbi:putative sporulation protein YtxC [Anaeroselena agilis]|uniref:Sporulation protein YtxC n=1 Tax=Anaeroselena agilis TaxID=3063788 RepID=A0ABU3NYN9_9FIRM|nr:putative sporulation protein YtxC [Selenomonadales bacterium 4137-cl]